MPDNSDARARMKLFAQFEQILAGLENRDPKARKRAQTILGHVALDGDYDMLGEVFRGLIREWDSDQEQFDNDARE